MPWRRLLKLLHRLAPDEDPERLELEARIDAVDGKLAKIEQRRKRLDLEAKARQR